MGTQISHILTRSDAHVRPALLAEMLERGRMHQTSGEKSAAEEIYRQVLEIDPQQPDALHLLGVIEYEKRNPEGAIDLIQQAIRINRSKAAYFLDLGTVCRAQGYLQRAAQSYIESIRLNPKSAEAYVNLGNIFQDGQQYDDALACYHQAVTLKPSLIGAHNNLANGLRKLCRFDEALESYRKALELDPSRASTHYNMASLLCDLGKLDEAMAHCRRCLELGIEAPDRVLFLQGLIELVRGNYAAGWEHYEKRWGNPDHDTPNRNYRQPRWNGKPLSGGNLLIWGEQGIGDEIMFAGLIPDAMRIGVHCILECDSRLQPLFARSFPGIDTVSRPLDESAIDFAAHIPCASLPGIFRASEEAFQATKSPYLIADPERRQSLRARYGNGKPVIGLAWKTNSKKSGHLRSIPLTSFEPIFASGAYKAVCLQYGDQDQLEAEAQAARLPLRVDREIDQLKDMDGFAAQIAALDLVITIDNSTAHLAGALGVPAWLLLPYTPDWRWQLNREDSPWYPSLRIFRQQQLTQWEPVIERVRNALQSLNHSHSAIY